MTRRPWAREMGAAAVVMAALVTGCFVGSSSSTSSGSAGGGGTSSAPPSQPMLAIVDTGQTLDTGNGDGGGGVGVFTDYQSGGHWRVRWTCDTSVTGLDCQFSIKVSVTQGTIANVNSQISSAASQLTQPSTAELFATTTTTTAVDGVLFDTTPGATITLEAGVNGADNGAFLFFVQDNAVNGGYKGTLSDPLMLQPSSP